LGIIIPKMGRTVEQTNGLAGALFGRVQMRLLGLLFGNPSRTFHASELIRLARSGSGAVQRELKRLADAGLLSVTMSGNRRLYRANRHAPIFEELRGIIVKTVGLLEPLRRALETHASNISVAFVYGSVARGQDTANSDIDLMIIGDGLSYSQVYAALQNAEKMLLRSVNPTLMTRAEWAAKRTENGSFVSKVVHQPKLFVSGSHDALRGIGQSGPSRAPESRSWRAERIRRPRRVRAKALG
jgi:predicted nucleotidyltransferase